MPTLHPRLNITLDELTFRTLENLAKKLKQSVSGVAKDLILESLELQEDLALSKIARQRDRKSAPRVSHSDVWK